MKILASDWSRGPGRGLMQIIQMTGYINIILKKILVSFYKSYNSLPYLNS